MKCILIDTHTFVWMADDDSRLSPRAWDTILSASQVLISSASLWELAIKFTLGKIWSPIDDFGDAIDRALALSGAEILPITPPHTIMLTRLPLIHRAPFDRMLVAQAISERLVLVSQDRHVAQYPCDVVW